MPTKKQILDSIEKKHPELIISVKSLPESLWREILGEDWHDISAGEARKRIGALTREIIARETPDKRSPKWPKVSKKHLDAHPFCIACGNANRKLLVVHHIKPYSLFPEDELNPENLVTMCEGSDVLNGLNCHLLFGHLLSWTSSNPNVVKCAAEMLKVADKIREKR